LPFGWLTDDMPRPIPPAEGPCPELALAVRELTKGLTLRQAANRTGGRVSHDTIRRAMDGQRISVEKLDLLAFAFNVNPNELRQAAGHGLLPKYPDPVSGEMVEEEDRNPPGALVQYTPEGYKLTLLSPDDEPVPLPSDTLRRIDLEIRLSQEREQPR
jgi:transcriptional regulator with XRE-family HTH domain